MRTSSRQSARLEDRERTDRERARESARSIEPEEHDDDDDDAEKKSATENDSAVVRAPAGVRVGGGGER